MEKSEPLFDTAKIGIREQLEDIMDNFKSKKGIKEESLMKIIKEDVKLNKFFENKKNIKSIFIKDKLINLIIK